MNVLEKAEKAIEFLKNNEGSKKSHELQAAAGTLGRCLGALGSRPSYARHYANLLHVAIPTILSLASNDSAEVRLVGDEALNRAVVGGFAFHAYKTNIILQNQIDVTRNARWIRAALSRVCLGECWVRPGVGKIRAQAQTLFPKLSQIVRQTREIQLIVEALEANLPRILDALAEYTTDEEMTELSKALLSHIESTEPAVRRGVANTVARLCSHRPPLLSNVLDKVFDNLWPQSSDNNVVLGWFGMVRAIFQINDIQKLADENLFVTQDYLEIYQLILHYIEQSTVEHNIQNSIMECLSVLLSHATGEFKKALLEKQGRCANLDLRVNKKGHSRNISSVSAITSIISSISYDTKDSEPADSNELTISGALHLGGLQWDTPRRSLEDLSIQTPDSPTSEMAVELDTTQLSKDLSEKLHEVEASRADSDGEVVEPAGQGFKVNIGSSHDEDSALKYCARLLVSKFILTGYKGGLIPDRSVRVSVKASALNCLSEILRLYPQAMTAYLDKEVDIKSHNVSGASEGTDSNQDNINDFILERNVCFQDSMSESLSQDLFNKSMDYPLPNTAHQIFKKDSRSLEKSIDSIEQKSSLKDVPSHILDSKVYLKNDLMASGISADSANTNANMTNSNITSNSNMTGSNDPTYYPMTSSADVLSSSIDLDMKFDHFGESNTNLDNLDAMKELEKPKRSLKRTEEVQSKDAPEASLDINDEEKVDECVKEYEYQHMSDVFVLLCDHSDPQIRGLVRVCIGNYLYAALELSHGDYYRWRNYSVLPKDVSENINTDKLVEIVLKGLSDEIHSCVNHTLTAVTKICAALSNSTYHKLLPDILNSLVAVEKNSYWLCKVNLCKLYEKLPYRRLFILCPGYRARSRMIMDTLYRMLSEQDHKIRSAAAHAIATITPKIYPSQRDTPVKAVIKSAVEQSRIFTFEQTTLALNLVKEMYFTHDLPQQLKGEKRIDNVDSLKVVVNDLMARLLESSCKFYSQGLLEALLTLMKAWPPWDNPTAYSDQRILDYCLDSIECRSGTVAERTMLVEICTLVYPVEIHNIMRHKTTNRDIFERDASTASKWQHLEDSRMSALCEKYQLIVMKFLNVVVHLVEEVSPTSMMNKGTFPGSPVRRNVTDSLPRKPIEGDDKGSLKRKPAVSISNVKSNFAGNFYSEPFYLQFYELLRATHSNHKINLDPKSSIFHDFLSTVLDALAIQLELSTEREFGYVTEELLYYLKTIMPLKADKSVYCVTQLLKCLFGTNMVNQYNDFASIAPVIEEKKETYSFYEDVLLINKLSSLDEAEVESRRSSVNSISSRKVSIESKNPKLVAERSLLVNLESFNKNKMDRKWTTNKKELERYIRLFEPVVIQALKSYTMQNDTSLQRRVLWLLSQLLALRVNYCMLDSDQVFIAVLLKQLDLAEQREIPDCVELVGDIMLFLVHLSSSKHHSKQIIELPKLIQLCDGLLASGATTECIAALERVSYLAFSKNGAMVPQQLGIAREVLQAMLCKTMQDRRSLELVSLVLALSQDTYSQMSQLTADTLLSRLSTRTIEVDTTSDVLALERIIDYIQRDVLLEQSRVEMVLKILFLAPPPQTTTPFKLKVRYLAIIMVLLRKFLVLIPESEILLSINYLKATYISPQSIFFNMKTEIDPLNVQNVNENCANLSPDVILVRFLFRTLTYAILEMENCHEMDRANLELEEESDKNQSHKLLYAVTVNLICQIKHMLHLTNGCLFPLTSKTAQTILHNEQSNLNTGLYSWEENIPLQLLLLVCVRLCPILTGHLSHLLIR
ncbi:unnamed protein product [Plutella xylostella]|uniref:(diamondback moth) hypothetical protein n=1 Tax=Plutella xylostella TaxID=51655 RepID=A0A8S4ERD5_PLUXY|nr:unnamed protein product [Plutella xylostella]